MQVVEVCLKNLPFSEFIFFADHWLKKNPAAMLFFSFGEADLKLVEEFSSTLSQERENVEYKIFSSLKDFIFLIYECIPEVLREMIPVLPIWQQCLVLKLMYGFVIPTQRYGHLLDLP